MSKITNYSKLKQDLDKYQNTINCMPDQSYKDKNQKILNQLKAAFQRIDNGHDTSFNGKIKPEVLRDTIIETVELRRQLEKLVKDVKNL